MTHLLNLQKLQAQQTYVMRTNKIKTEIFQHQILSNSLNIHSIQPSNDFMSVKKIDHFSSSGEKGFLMSH